MKKLYWPDLFLEPINLWSLARQYGVAKESLTRKTESKPSLNTSRVIEVKNNIYQSRSKN